MRRALAIVRLARPDSSILVFLSVCVPVVSRTGDVALGLRRAAPLLFVSACTFVLNDLGDLEKDQVNHPDRPLPRGEIKTALVATAYFVCLALALLTTRGFVRDPLAAFWYYGLLAMCISYGYVVEFLPDVKTLYVSITAAIPVLIVGAFYPGEPRLYLLAGAVVFFTLGRELLMDLRDIPGDPDSWVRGRDSTHVEIAAFLLQLIGLGLAVGLIRDFVGGTVFTGMAVLTAAAVLWARLRRLSLAVRLMKVVLFLGLYFLL